LGEVAMMRYKTLIGRRLHARTLSKQNAEAAGCKVINVMTSFGNAGIPAYHLSPTSGGSAAHI
jgi:hypothetical protein